MSDKIATPRKGKGKNKRPRTSSPTDASPEPRKKKHPVMMIRPSNFRVSFDLFVCLWYPLEQSLLILHVYDFTIDTFIF